MRPIVARALTVALASTGAAWAIVLPSLTLGEARSPSHAFAIPAPGGDVVIEASRPGPPQSRNSRRSWRARPQSGARRREPSSSWQLPARRTARGHRRAPRRRPQARPAAAPRPLRRPTPTPAPAAPAQPEPQPAAEPPVRALAPVVVVEQPTEAADDDGSEAAQGQAPQGEEAQARQGAKERRRNPPGCTPRSRARHSCRARRSRGAVAVAEADQDEPKQDEPASTTTTRSTAATARGTTRRSDRRPVVVVRT